MLAYSKNHAVWKMTQDAINSLRASSTEYKFNIIVVETENTQISYDGATVIQPNKKFNYNAFLNIGFEKCTSDYIIVANNDLIFHPNWFEEVVKAGYDSSSCYTEMYQPHLPVKGKIIPGYQTGYHLCGWCIVMKKVVLEKIGKFDEQFDFWYQDNDYSRQLEKHGLTHALIGTSWVTHLYSQSHKLISPKDLEAKTTGSQAKFDKKYRTTACLTMIVKDESPIVLEALNSVYKFINYWVIVDTGSTDDTKEKITNFFKEKGIPGELHERPWVNFGFNRTESLDLANGKCDYMVVMDADDIITGDINFNNLVADYYMVKHGQDFVYWRAQVFKSNKNWKYVGVIHEAPMSDKAKTVGRIDGKYDWLSRTAGARSKDPLKYQKDAQVLEKAILDEPTNTRYWFYLAQSYFDYGDNTNAKRCYQKRVELGGWPEEAFYAQYRVGLCAIKLNEPMEQVINEMLKAYNIRPSRGESLCTLATYLRSKNLPIMGYPFALVAAGLPMPNEDMLFVHGDVYRYRALDELAISAHYSGRVKESYEINKKLLDRPIAVVDQDRIKANMITQARMLGLNTK